MGTINCALYTTVSFFGGPTVRGLDIAKFRSGSKQKISTERVTLVIKFFQPTERDGSQTAQFAKSFSSVVHYMMVWPAGS